MRTGEDGRPPNGDIGRRLRTSYARVAMSGGGEDGRTARGEHGRELGCEHAGEHAEDVTGELLTEPCDERGVPRVGDEPREDRGEREKESGPAELVETAETRWRRLSLSGTEPLVSIKNCAASAATPPASRVASLFAVFLAARLPSASVAAAADSPRTWSMETSRGIPPASRMAFLLASLETARLLSAEAARTAAALVAGTTVSVVTSALIAPHERSAS